MENLPARGDGRFLNLRQAASELDVSVNSVSRWVKSGRLPAIRLGPRTIRIREADVRALMRPAAELDLGSEEGFPLEPIVVPAERLSAVLRPLSPDEVWSALRGAAGALEGVDIDTLKRTIRAERGQFSKGRRE